MSSQGVLTPVREHVDQMGHKITLKTTRITPTIRFQMKNLQFEKIVSNGIDGLVRSNHWQILQYLMQATGTTSKEHRLDPCILDDKELLVC